jgi:hypothetical protein
VCDAHGLGATGAAGSGKAGPAATRAWCTTCAKELADDLDVARFAIDVHEVPPDSGALFHRSTANAALAHYTSRALASVRGWFESRRVKRAFARRTPEQIAAWRRAAGVRMRG